MVSCDLAMNNSERREWAEETRERRVRERNDGEMGAIETRRKEAYYSYVPAL